MMPKTIIYLVANDRYFCTHRLSLGIAAKNKGYRIIVAAPPEGAHLHIIESGLEFYHLPFNRSSLNPFTELKTVIKIVKLYWHHRPDIVHHVAIKPALYGTIAARLCRVPKLINAISGLGHLFTSDNKSPLKSLFRFLAKLLFKSSCIHTIVQNPDDLDEMKELVKKGQLTLILGAGVDLNHFKPMKESSLPIIVTHVSRMLWTKGIGELVQVAKELKSEGQPIIIQLVGEPDLHNPANIPEATLQAWHDDGVIQWLRFQSDIAPIYQKSHIAVLASSYREGIPKSLLEAAACGKPIITTDMPGCRIVAEHNVNGILISPKDIQALKQAILLLANNAELRHSMGGASRRLATELFDQEKIIEQTLSLYS